jgi:hypothetical protein
MSIERNDDGTVYFCIKDDRENKTEYINPDEDIIVQGRNLLKNQ